MGGKDPVKAVLVATASIGAAVLLAGVSGCGTVASAPQPQPGTNGGTTNFLQARRNIMAAIQSEGYAVYVAGRLFSSRHAPIEVRVTERNLVISHPRESRAEVVDWRTLRPMTAGRFAGSAYASDSGTGTNPGLSGARLHVYLKREDTAQAVASALNWLAAQAQGAHAADRAASLAEFKRAAATWRDTSPHPPLPAEAARQRILAEDALAGRRYEEALEHYEAGLAAAPLWPEGHFNAAILYAELEAFQHATDHLLRYLELVPDAPDAQSAHEKLILWEEKLKQ